MVNVKWMVALLVGMFLAGCNTMEGLNKDLKKGGDEIRKSSEQVYKSLKTDKTE